MVLVVFLFHHQEQRLLAEFEAHKCNHRISCPKTKLRVGHRVIVTASKFKPLPFFNKKSIFLVATVKSYYARGVIKDG